MNYKLQSTLFLVRIRSAESPSYIDKIWSGFWHDWHKNVKVYLTGAVYPWMLHYIILQSLCHVGSTSSPWYIGLRFDAVNFLNIKYIGHAKYIPSHLHKPWNQLKTAIVYSEKTPSAKTDWIYWFSRRFMNWTEQCNAYATQNQLIKSKNVKQGIKTVMLQIYYEWHFLSMTKKIYNVKQ